MVEILIKRVLLEDIELLQKIGRQTFSETFSSSNSSENMQKYLEESFAKEKLILELQNVNSIFFFAQYKNEVVGYLKINFGANQTELKDDKAVEIERIYVLQAYQGNKIGQLLYEKAIQVANESKADYIWLGVWEENQKAIKFYTKNGFVPFDKHIFKLGHEEQTDIMMKLEL
jgi:ribosomal protein S18 acetylase RimI-like enzyme